MKLLLTATESFDSPGFIALNKLANVVVGKKGECASVTPTERASYSAHRVTVGRPLTLTRVRDLIFTLDGTPVDCVRIASRIVMPEVNWVIAGLNRGGNLGAEIFASATVAAAREAAILGIPAIAISHVRERGREIDWDLAVKRSISLVRALINSPLERGSFWNINLPHPRHDRDQLEVVFRPLDTSPLEIEYEQVKNKFTFRQQYHAPPILRGHDVEACIQGKITVTRLSIKGPSMAHPGEQNAGHSGG
jgi:5'-nucleotidase